jgi:hypothetical protein
MKKLILLLALAAFAQAGLLKFTAKHIAKPVLVHGVVKPLKLIRRLLW